MQASTEKGNTSGPFGRQDPGLPQVFGRYLLIQRLSRGGMGEIFLAKHGLAGFEKLAVIKKVLPHLAADAQFISRFVDEAQVAIKLQHVNVAQVFEVGRVADEYFLALEYVEGRDLRRTLGLLGHRKQRLPVDLALFIGRELANGLAYAHRRTGPDGASLDLVHCDISPPNVLVSFEGETKVIDFGIAKSAIRGTATDPKMGFGKFGYMAPEQLIRGGVVDHRTDIYAAGVVLYELLTGQRLYEAGPEPDYRTLARMVAKGEHSMPSDIDPALDLYDDLVATALRPKAEDRYQTAAEFRDAIQQCLVSVNPTISTDQLGAYMRDLFFDEMNAQKELHERVAKTHLSDFHEAFHTATISTVSFAMAQLPLQAPPDGAAPVAPLAARPSGRTKKPTQAPPPPSSISASKTIPTPRVVDDDLALADGTGTSVRHTTVPRSKTGLYVVMALATVAVAAVVAIALTRGFGDRPVASAEPSSVNQGVTIVPIEPAAAAGSAAGSAASVAPGSGRGSAQPIVEAGSAAVAPKPDPKPEPKPKTRPHRPDRADRVPADKPKPEPLTREAVKEQFKLAGREYASYKAKNGGRLESEWNDLAQFMTFQLTAANLDAALRKVEGFRGRMRE